MFILGEIFKALAMLVSGICMILYWCLCARIIISWFPVDPYSNIVQFLYQVTDPLLVPFRRIALRIGPIDFTPLLAFILLMLLRNVLVVFLTNLAIKFQGG